MFLLSSKKKKNQDKSIWRYINQIHVIFFVMIQYNIISSFLFFFSYTNIQIACQILDYKLNQLNIPLHTVTHFVLTNYKTQVFRVHAITRRKMFAVWPNLDSILIDRAESSAVMSVAAGIMRHLVDRSSRSRGDTFAYCGGILFSDDSRRATTYNIIFVIQLQDVHTLISTNMIYVFFWRKYEWE